MARNHKHFCPGRDFLLIKPGDPEMDSCTCRTELERRKATETYDDQVDTYYIEIEGRAAPPYLEQRHFQAVLNVADDGTFGRH
jgi:hypothetical protein